MKTLSKISAISSAIAICIATLLFYACSTSAQEPGRLFFKADAGGNHTSDTDLQEFFGQDTTGAKVKFDVGFRFGVGVGYFLTEWLAVEGETGVFANNIDSIGGAALHDAYFYNFPFLVNLRLQGPNRWPVQPYIGGGVGGSIAVLDIDHLDRTDPADQTSTIHLHGSDSEGVFAYQGFAGIRWKINYRMGLSVEYRYFGTDAPSWHGDVDTGNGFFDGRIKFGRTETQSLSLAFDFHF